jgi:hypothetical protein
VTGPIRGVDHGAKDGSIAASHDSIGRIVVGPTGSRAGVV